MVVTKALILLLVNQEALLAELKASGLRLWWWFPNWRKMGLPAKDASHPVYLVVNLDESEPACLKIDMLYRDPHTILEALSQVVTYLVQTKHLFSFVENIAKGQKVLRKRYKKHERLGLWVKMSWALAGILMLTFT